MKTDKDFTGPVNIGNPNEIKIIDLCTKIVRLSNSDSDISYKSLPIDDPKRRKPDISIAINKLNWEPKVDLNIGLLNTINYFKNNA